MSKPQTLYLASALITNEAGSLLTVRKKGSIYYMMAGGKIEPGETPIEALQRELKEELDLAIESHLIHHLGTHQTQAVNEANTIVHATIYHLKLVNPILVPHAELEEIRWLTYDTYQQVPLAHLLEEFSIPIWLQNKKSQL
ncbi:NUDIX domain-containing protein [Myroides sp. WP-1]|uniref:NUDIX hydrolase n=1 Tax=Myroides sp. WP-1 TaxID=2759944 RepID=UPI0015FE28B0|nr:NUDIX domain-containing protein [Myroides sp. WP-1]MBB1140787.1 NUDIX domain-containing protein [Myroides sp. WP-1]